jgi:hypothetical protein
MPHSIEQTDGERGGYSVPTSTAPPFTVMHSCLLLYIIIVKYYTDMRFQKNVYWRPELGDHG